MAARKFNRDAPVPGGSVPAPSRRGAAARKSRPKRGVNAPRPDAGSRPPVTPVGKAPPPLSKAEIVREIEGIQDSLWAAYGTATAVYLALKNGLEATDEEVGICLGRHVVEELWQIGEQYDWMLHELGGNPRFLPITSAD